VSGNGDTKPKRKARRKHLLSVRLDTAIVARLDALAAVLKRPGREPLRTDAILATVFAGLEAFEHVPPRPPALSPAPPSIPPAAARSRSR
jgi:hypothetical protein